MKRVDRWTKQLGDHRSKRVVFLSHCLLNENTRYLGGACELGVVRCVVHECIDRGLGIVQMPCPEQHAWGGVLKLHMLRYFGCKDSLIYRTGKVALPLLLWYTRCLYRSLAQRVANEIHDYTSSGLTVAGIVGVDGSPSCGVSRALDVGRSLDLVAELTPEATRQDMNAIVLRCVIEGKGLFVAELRKELLRRGLSMPFSAYDLPSELQGRPHASALGNA